jgi:hypothetical protein
MLYLDCGQRFADAAKSFAKALEIDDSFMDARQHLVFLHRDYLEDTQTAKQVFESLRAKHPHEAEDIVYLHEALFAAYDLNWGICAEALTKALEVTGHQFPYKKTLNWCRASAILLHLNYGEELLEFLRKQGDDARLRPWYEALSALHQGDRRYLQNIPVEVRTTAEYYFDQIEKRLNALPERTRRRPMPQPVKRRQERKGVSSLSEPKKH